MMTEFQKEMARRRQQSEEREYKRYGDIYSECVKKGCDLDFVKSFTTRIWLYPVEQTKTFIDFKARGRLDRFEIRKVDALRQWEIYLSVLMRLRPNEDKAEEWKESRSLIEYYQKTGGFKDAEPFGFWLTTAGDMEYIDILIKQNGENSEIVSFLDRVYGSIEKNSRGSEEMIVKIRNTLTNNGFPKQVEQCDREFVDRYKP